MSALAATKRREIRAFWADLKGKVQQGAALSVEIDIIYQTVKPSG